MTTFKHEVRERRTEVQESEHLSAEIAGYDVCLSKSGAMGVWTLDIAPIKWDRLRLPLLRFYPKNVDDLDRLAEALPSLLHEVAAALRNEGREDLRSEQDRWHDEWEVERQRIHP